MVALIGTLGRGPQLMPDLSKGVESLWCSGSGPDSGGCLTFLSDLGLVIEKTPYKLDCEGMQHVHACLGLLLASL